MNLIRCFFCFILLIFVSCSNNISNSVDSEQKGENENFERLSQSELSLILKDILIVESALYFKSNQGADVRLMTNVYYRRIFKKFSISRNQFYQSLKYHIQKDIHASSMFLESVNMLTVETDSVRKNQTSLKEPDIEQKTTLDTTKKFNHFFGKRLK